MDHLERAIVWLRDAADEHDEGDAIWRALALVLQRWLQGPVITLTASKFNEELAAAELAGSDQ